MLRQRLILSTTCLLSIAALATRTRGEWVEMTQRDDGLKNYAQNPFGAFERGAAVYVGTVTDVLPAPPAATQAANPNRGDMAGQRALGHVTLRLTHVLRGPKSDTATLPYAYWRMPPLTKRTVPELWPRVEELKAEQQLLYVVLPGPFLNNPELAGEKQAACAVYPINGPDDPIVKAYVLMTKLDALQGPELTAASLAAAENPHPIVRAYLATTALYRLQRAPGISLTTALTSVYLKPNAPDDHIAIAEIDYIARRDSSSETVRAQAARSLAALVEAPDPYVREDACTALFNVAGMLRSSDLYFTPAERKHIHDAFLKSGAEMRSPPALPQLAAWMEEPPHPLFTPLTGDFYLLKNDLWKTLHHGGALYLASIAQRKQTSGPDPATTAGLTPRVNPWPTFGGQLQLTIEATLLGPPRQSLTQDYAYHLFPHYQDYWPNLDRLPKDAKLLCVVMPRLGLPENVKQDSDLVACTVLAVTGKDDPIVKAFERMLSWDSLEGPALKKALLAEAAANVVGLPRDYLCVAAMNRLDPADGIDVLAALVHAMAQGKPRQEDDFSGRGALFCMDLLLGPSATSDPALQKRVIQSAAEAIGSADLANAADGLTTLLAMSKEAPDGGATLSAEHKATIQHALTQIGGSMDASEKEKIQTWITSASKP